MRKCVIFAPTAVNVAADCARGGNFYKLFWISNIKLELGEFIFKFNNNVLYTKEMISHFILDELSQHVQDA